MSNEHTSQALTRSDRIEGAIDKGTTSGLQINRAGQVNFVNANEIMEFAKMMALGRQAIPAHLRESPGACLAVCIQASSWQMSPFAVANKSYVVNDRMAYEAQIIAAVILMRAPIIGRLKYTYKGEGPTRQCTCSAKLDDGETVEVPSPMVKDIKVKNSPLWVSDPDQQLAYYTARALARRHFPDVILGVYTPEEMAEETLRDVTPVPGKPSLHDEPETPKKPEPPPEQPKQKPPATPTPEQEAKLREQPKPEAAKPQKTAKTATPKEEPAKEQAAAKEEPAPKEQPAGEQAEPDPEIEKERQILISDINELADQAELSTKKVREWAAAQGLMPDARPVLASYPVEALRAIKERWTEISPAK